jgi:hypothetical protein
LRHNHAATTASGKKLPNHLHVAYRELNPCKPLN